MTTPDEYIHARLDSTDFDSRFQLLGTILLATESDHDLLQRMIATVSDLNCDEFPPENPEYQRGQIELIANLIHSRDGDPDLCRDYVEWAVRRRSLATAQMP